MIAYASPTDYELNYYVNNRVDNFDDFKIMLQENWEYTKAEWKELRLAYITRIKNLLMVINTFFWFRILRCNRKGIGLRIRA